MGIIIDGVDVQNFYVNNKKYKNVYIDGVRVLGDGEPPIVTGDFIWYDMKSFLTKEQGTRWVDDIGENLRDSASGRFDGALFSGKNITLTGTESISIEVPYQIDGDIYQDKISLDGTGQEIDLGNGDWKIFNTDPNSSDLKVVVADVITAYPDALGYIWESDITIVGNPYVFRKYYDGPDNTGAYVYLPLGFTEPKDGERMKIKVNSVKGDYAHLTFDNSEPNDICDLEFRNNVVYPIIATGSVTYFDALDATFKQILDTPFVSLREMTVGSLAVLDIGKSFSQEDLDAFTADPDLFIAWGLGQATIPSGIIKDTNDKLFAVFEDAGDILIEIEAIVENIDLTLPADTIQNGWTDNGDGSYTFDLSDGSGYISWDFKTEMEIDKDYLVCMIIEGVADAQILSLPYDGANYVNVAGKNGKVWAVSRFDSKKGFIYASTSNIPITIRDYCVKRIYGDTIQMLRLDDGSSLIYLERNLRSNVGAQTIRYEMNEAGVPKELIDSNYVNFFGDSEYIDSMVVIDGSTNHFTMMQAFGNPEQETGFPQYVAATAGNPTVDNVLQLQYSADMTQCFALIGKSQFDITSALDPNQTTHAMCAVFDNNTHELVGAVDGSNYQSFGIIDFDGPTPSSVYFGNSAQFNQPFSGKISEGILSANKESENSWLEFWNRVKDNIPIEIGDYIWYSLYPTTGYLTQNGVRYVKDLGSSDIPKHGLMHSGCGFYLGEDYYVPIPINYESGIPRGAVVYFNHDLKRFVQVTADGTNSVNILESPLSFSHDGTEDTILLTVLSNTAIGSTFIFETTINNLYSGEVVLPYDAMNIGYIVDTAGTFTNTAEQNNEGDFIVYGFAFDGDGQVNSAKEILPHSDTYFLRGGKIGSIAVLWDQEFTQEDLDKLNEEPELFIRWGMGEYVGLSISKSPNDKFYPAFELNGEILLEINGDIDLDNDYFVPPLSYDPGWIDNGDGSYTFDSTQAIDNRGFLENIVDHPDGNLNKVFYSRMYIESDNNLDNLSLPYDGSGYMNFELTKNKYVDGLSGWQSSSKGYIFANKVSGDGIATIKNISVHEVLGDYLSILSELGDPLTRVTRYSNLSTGPQRTRFKIKASAVVEQYIETQHLKFDNHESYIDTDIVIDGSQTSFSMMLAFTPPEENLDVYQYLASSGYGSNRIYLFHNKDYPKERFNIQIGQNTFVIDVTPNLPINAICAVYNHNTGELLAGFDGNPLQSMGTITFDGSTDRSLVFGVKIPNHDAETYSYNGYIGQGVASADVISETEWQEFWNNVKDDDPNVAPSSDVTFEGEIVTFEGEVVTFTS